MFLLRKTTYSKDTSELSKCPENGDFKNYAKQVKNLIKKTSSEEELDQKLEDLRNQIEERKNRPISWEVEDETESFEDREDVKEEKARHAREMEEQNRRHEEEIQEIRRKILVLTNPELDSMVENTVVYVGDKSISSENAQERTAENLPRSDSYPFFYESNSDNSDSMTQCEFFCSDDTQKFTPSHSLPKRSFISITFGSVKRILLSSYPYSVLKRLQYFYSSFYRILMDFIRHPEKFLKEWMIRPLFFLISESRMAPQQAMKQKKSDFSPK
uniref:Uncharacterized protein n=1 Tax=Caenorhabditis tropicalis TaxID=1561998 RepID=A0A1I7SY65_9PELO